MITDIDDVLETLNPDQLGEMLIDMCKKTDIWDSTTASAIIRHGGNINYVNKHGESPILESAFAGNHEAFAFLVDNGAIEKMSGVSAVDVMLLGCMDEPHFSYLFHKYRPDMDLDYKDEILKKMIAARIFRQIRNLNEILLDISNHPAFR